MQILKNLSHLIELVARPVLTELNMNVFSERQIFLFILVRIILSLFSFNCVNWFTNSSICSVITFYIFVVSYYACNANNHTVYIIVTKTPSTADSISHKLCICLCCALLCGGYIITSWDIWKICIHKNIQWHTSHKITKWHNPKQ